MTPPASSVSPAQSTITTTTLEVVTGLHRDAVIEIEGDTCRIGTDDAADVWLGDSGVAPLHAVLRFHGRQMAVEAVGGDVQVNGRTVAQGTGVRSELPARISFAGVTLRLTPPLTRSLMPGLPSLPAIWHKTVSRYVPLVALGTTVGVLVIYEFVGANPADANIGTSAAIVELDQQTIEGARQAGSDPRMDATQALRDRITQAGLKLDVDQKENHLSVSGHYTPEQAAIWQQIQHWFDRRYGSEQVLLNAAQLQTKTDTPDLHLRAVWLGQTPYVIDDRGERLYPGASLSSGWTISSIDDDCVLLSRGDKQFALTH